MFILQLGEDGYTEGQSCGECVCERERERERGTGNESEGVWAPNYKRANQLLAGRSAHEVGYAVVRNTVTNDPTNNPRT